MPATFVLPRQVAILGGAVAPSTVATFFQTGTSTPQSVYTDAALTNAVTSITADSAGVFAKVYLNPNAAANYRVTLTPPGGTPYTEDDISRYPVTQAEIGAALYPRTAAELAASITPANYAYPERNLLRYTGVIADGSTDCTSVVLAVCNAMGGMFLLPYSVQINHQTLISGLDTNVLIINESMINDLTSPGETTKTWGIISSDEPVNDSSLILSSGHHPNLLFNNYGTAAGSSAADGRVMSIVWASGQMQNQGLAKRGSRGAAAIQFHVVPSTDFWIWKVQKFAPGASLLGAYEQWVAGEVIAGSGVYRRNSGGHYVSANSGTTAASGPSHITGTVADGGGVQWTFVDSADSQIISIDQHSRVLVGNAGTGTETFEHKVTATDPGAGHYTMILRGGKPNAQARLRLHPVDGSNNQVNAPYLQAANGTGLGVVRADGANYMLTLDDTKGVRVENHAFSVHQSATAPATASSGTIATAGLGTSRVSPAGNITGVILQAGSVPGQTVSVINESSFSITFATFATSNVADGLNIVIPTARAMSFRWNSSVSAWYAQA